MKESEKNTYDEKSETIITEDNMGMLVTEKMPLFITNGAMLLDDLLYDDIKTGNRFLCPYYAFVFCVDGEMDVYSDGKEHHITMRNILFHDINSRIEIQRVSKNINIKILICRDILFFNSFPSTKKVFDYIRKKSNEAVIKYDDLTRHFLLTFYESARIVCKIDSVYKEKAIEQTLSAWLIVFMSSIENKIIEEEPQTTFNTDRKIYEEFLITLRQDGGIHRDTSYFTNKIHCSINYLNKISRNYSGKTASQIIKEYAYLYISDELARSHNKTETAKKFGFPSLNSLKSFIHNQTKGL